MQIRKSGVSSASGFFKTLLTLNYVRLQTGMMLSRIDLLCEHIQQPLMNVLPYSPVPY